MSAAELYPCDDSVVPTFNNLKLRHKHKWVCFCIANNKHTVKSVESDMSKTVHDLVATLSDSECLTIIFEYKYTSTDGRPTDKLFFISWLPRAASNPDKMMHTTARPSVRAACPGCVLWIRRALLSLDSPYGRCFDLQASTKSDILDGVLKQVSQKDDDEEDGEDGDWMDGARARCVFG